MIKVKGGYLHPEDIIDDCSTKTTINKRTIVDLPVGKAGILAFKTRFGKEKASKKTNLNPEPNPYLVLL